MTEQQAQEQEVRTEQEAPQETKSVSYEEYEELKNRFESVMAKNSELLGETKKAKEARRQAEEQARIEAEEKAKKAGDYEHLHKSSEERRLQLERELQEVREGVSNEKRNAKAYEIASELAAGANEAKLLTDHIARRLKYDNGDIMVLDAAGNPSVQKLDELKAEINSNAMYSALLKGNQASGGGATGGSQGASGAKTATRSEFARMSPQQKMEFSKANGKLTDD